MKHEKKHHIHKGLPLLMALGLFLVLVSCGGPKAPSEKQIQADLAGNPVFLDWAEPLQAELTGIEVVKRKTDKEGGTDMVYLSANVRSDTFEGTRSYALTYNLYNEGWLLDFVEDNRSSGGTLTPLRGLTEEELFSMRELPEGAENFEVIENTVDLETGIQTVTCRYEEPHVYCTVERIDYYQFEFDNETSGQWRQKHHDRSTTEHWDLNGTYRCSEPFSRLSASGVFNVQIELEMGEITYSDGDETDDVPYEANGSYTFEATEGLDEHFVAKSVDGPYAVFRNTFYFSSVPPSYYVCMAPRWGGYDEIYFFMDEVYLTVPGAYLAKFPLEKVS